jgi:hypothetical protein
MPDLLSAYTKESEVHVVVETPRGSAKLEFDPVLKVFTLS